MTDDAGNEAGGDDAAAAEGVDERATDGGEGAAEEVGGASPAGEGTADERGAGDAESAGAGSAASNDEPTATDDERAATDGDASESVPGPAVGADAAEEADDDAAEDVPDDVAKYDRFQKMERAEYDRVNEFLRDRTYVTAREWAIARLCADFRTETGVEMTKIGENLPRLVPFMTDTYTPQAVNQARASFEEKVRKAGATFLYGAMSGFFTAEDLDDVMYESTEIAKFLLEVEGADLTVEEELAAEDKISSVMRDVREASAEVRGEEVKCPECGHVHEP
ncbi:DUF5806 family protein [Halobaculum gomorrense]|uniref:Uncharacterized protein n=1 Tax=Halobaculum gomorrense TaxID=43928 RepID=A0A1M5SU97_9EURY|nr:DUF5806 family protein [Halobaculum gomorrense]SHH42050.1 hypothetical protein SAMN05443636_2523 [Halobaculum gomorrense]